MSAVFKERGRGDGQVKRRIMIYLCLLITMRSQAASNVYDSVVNSLLTKMDGLEEARLTSHLNHAFTW